MPVFVDIEPDTCNIDAVADRGRDHAAHPGDHAGEPVRPGADMDEINAIAARHGLPVIEDAAQSFGATYKGRKSCNLSTIGCTSFFPSKPLGCYGDGGAIFTNDDALAQAMREIRVHGQSARYTHTRIGVGGRMDTLQCAVVLAKLGALRLGAAAPPRDRRGATTRACAALNLTTLTVRPDRDSVWAQYTVRVADRAHVQAVLTEAGVPDRGALSEAAASPAGLREVRRPRQLPAGDRRRRRGDEPADERRPVRRRPRPRGRGADRRRRRRARSDPAVTAAARPAACCAPC